MSILIQSDGQYTAGTPPEAAFTVLGGNSIAGVYQYFINCVNMALGDEIQIQVLEKSRAADAPQIIYEAVVSGPQNQPLWVSPCVVMFHGWSLQMRQTLGTARSFPWSIRIVS
jgi:hypothetical protein